MTMASTTFALKFSIACCDSISTLEAVLSAARRGGLSLAAITFVEGPHHGCASMRIHCADEDRVDLFLHRLRQLLDVSNVVVQPLYVAHWSATLAADGQHMSTRQTG